MQKNKMLLYLSLKHYEFSKPFIHLIANKLFKKCYLDLLSQNKSVLEYK